MHTERTVKELENSAEDSRWELSRGGAARSTDGVADSFSWWAPDGVRDEDPYVGSEALTSVRVMTLPVNSRIHTSSPTRRGPGAK